MFVISGLERGGAENQLVHLACSLAVRGWQVSVLSYLPFSQTSYAPALQRGGVTTCTLNAGTGVTRYFNLVRAVCTVGRFKPDILVGFMFHGIMTARIAGLLWRFTANVSSIRSERHRRLRERLLGATDRLTDAVTIMSRRLANELIRRRIATPVHTHVIPNGVAVARFDVADEDRGGIRGELAVTEDQFLWIAAGRLVPDKDYPTLLRAFSSLSQHRPDARLIIAGDGPLRNELSSLIQRMDLDTRVQLLGLRQDMPTLYAASDALVLSSAWEGMPGVVLEAMAARLPVVATSVGAIPEMVENGTHGFVVPPKDPTLLADAMQRVMDLPEESRREIGEKARSRIEREFLPDRVVDMWEDLFDRLLHAKRGNKDDAPG